MDSYFYDSLYSMYSYFLEYYSYFYDSLFNVFLFYGSLYSMYS